jgi:hypothetical protein
MVSMNNNFTTEPDLRELGNVLYVVWQEVTDMQNVSSTSLPGCIGIDRQQSPGALRDPGRLCGYNTT